MFNIETNFDEFIKSIDDAILALQKVDGLFGTPAFKTFINKLFRDVKDMFLKNINDWKVGEIDVQSDRWESTKQILMDKPLEKYEEILISRGYPASYMQRTSQKPEKVKSSEPWKATEFMSDDLIKGVNAPMNVESSENKLTLTFSSSFRNFLENYPLIVDEQIMQESQGQYSLLQLYDEQRTKLMSEFMEIVPKIIDQIFAEASR